MQQYLSMPFEQTQKQTEIARHLPPPLYVLFVQANAYSEACGGYSGPVKLDWIKYKHSVIEVVYFFFR